MGAAVGLTVGDTVGAAVGTVVGETVGAEVGAEVGETVGETVGDEVINVQTRSETCEGAWLSNETACSQAVTLVHTRSEVSVGAVDWNWLV